MAKGNGAVDDVIAIERELPCKLTDDELRMRGDAMADAELLVDMLKAERRAVNKKIFAATDQRNKLAHVIDAEIEPRVVVCKWIGDLAQNLWSLIRQDTGECVEQRAMTAADRQGSLAYGPADPGGLPEGDEHGEVHDDELADLDGDDGPVLHDGEADTDVERLRDEAIDAVRPKPIKRKPRSIAAAKARAKSPGPGKAKAKKPRRVHA